MKLSRWIHDKRGTVCVDADFFTLKEEQQLAPRVINWIAENQAGGVRIAFHDEHVELLKLLAHPIDFIVNFDYHMDCSLEFLHGEAARINPCSASLFENMLSTGRIKRYIWALPNSRYRDASLVYSSAFVRNNQPLLTRI